jgi:hypothetical protein
MKNICHLCFDYFEYASFIIYDFLCESEKILNEYGGV